MQKFFVGQRVSVLVPNHEFTGTIVRVIADSGACGGVYEVKPDHRPLDPECDFQTGDNLGPLPDHLALLGDHLKPNAEESTDNACTIIFTKVDCLIASMDGCRREDGTASIPDITIAVVHGMLFAAALLCEDGFKNPEIAKRSERLPRFKD